MFSLSKKKKIWILSLKSELLKQRTWLIAFTCRASCHNNVCHNEINEKRWQTGGD